MDSKMPPLGTPVKPNTPPKPKPHSYELKGKVLERKKHRCKLFLSDGEMDVKINSCPPELADRLEKNGSLHLTIE